MAAAGSQDYYELLEVQRDASPDEIKRAFRRLARELHPDANPGDGDAEARFKEVALAYETLSDPDRRQRYDTLRSRGCSRGHARWVLGAGSATCSTRSSAATPSGAGPAIGRPRTAASTSRP